MNGPTHRIGGLCAGAVCVTAMYGVDGLATHPVIASTIVFSAIMGSLVPDIDTTTSTISLKHPIIARIVTFFTTHREITHTFVPYIIGIPLVAIPTFALSTISHIFIKDFSLFGFYIIAMLGFMVGVISHFLLDMITTEGCPILYPIVKKKISIARLKGEKHGWIVSIVLILLTAIYMMYQKNGNWDFLIAIWEFIRAKAIWLIEKAKESDMVEIQ